MPSPEQQLQSTTTLNSQESQPATPSTSQEQIGKQGDDRERLPTNYKLQGIKHKWLKKFLTSKSTKGNQPQDEQQPSALVYQPLSGDESGQPVGTGSKLRDKLNKMNKARKANKEEEKQKKRERGEDLLRLKFQQAADPRDEMGFSVEPTQGSSKKVFPPDSVFDW